MEGVDWGLWEVCRARCWMGEGWDNGYRGGTYSVKEAL